MQNLRDKLLKVGLVDNKRKQEADTQARRERKQKGTAAQVQEEQARQKEYETRLAAEAEAQRRLEAQRAEDKARHEQHNRIRNIADRWALRQNKPGQQRFYFVQRSGRIGRLLVREEMAEQLSLGAVAIIERLPESTEAGSVLATTETHVLLPWEAAERILRLDQTSVRFWARRNQPIGMAEDPEPT